MRNVVIVVGYRTKVADGTEAYLPEFKVPTHWKDAARVKEETAARKAAFLAVAGDLPYTGTIADVCLFDRFQKKSFRFRSDVDGKAPPAVRFRTFLMSAYPEAWSEPPPADPAIQPAAAPVATTSVALVGFGITGFVRMLGAECMLRPPHERAPLSMWHTNRRLVDLTSLLLVPGTSEIDVPYIVRHPRLRPVDTAAAKKWVATLTGWEGLGVDPERDCDIATELAVRLGVL